MKPSEAAQSIMAIKQRIAVHASEFYKRDVQAYDFVIAIVSREKFKLSCLLDENETHARNLQLNPETHYLFVFEIEKLALEMHYFEGLQPNWTGQHVPEEIEEEDDDNEEKKNVDESGPGFADELQGRTVPPIKSSLDVLDPSWIQVLVY